MMTNKAYVQDRLTILEEEKKEIESQLQYAFSDAKVEQLEEQLAEPLNNENKEKNIIEIFEEKY